MGGPEFPTMVRSVESKITSISEVIFPDQHIQMVVNGSLIKNKRNPGIGDMIDRGGGFGLQLSFQEVSASEFVIIRELFGNKTYLQMKGATSHCKSRGQLLIEFVEIDLSTDEDWSFIPLNFFGPVGEHLPRFTSRKTPQYCELPFVSFCLWISRNFHDWIVK